MNAITAAIEQAESAWLRNWTDGPRRLRWTEAPVQWGDGAPSLTLRTEAGTTFELRDTWAKGPGVLVFLRHFGCGCAWDRAERLVAEYPKLSAAGASVIVIGQGNPLRCRLFRERAGLPCPVLSDEDCRAYEAYGLLHARPSQVVYGMEDAFLLRDRKTAEAFLERRRTSERRLVDSPWQLPGDFVVGADGLIKLAYRAQYCADYPDPNVLVSALREAALGL